MINETIGPPPDAIRALREHYMKVIVPTWRGTGFDPKLRLPFETVRAHGTPEPKRFRAMACARQLYIFALLGDYERATTLFNSLINYFHDSVHGGFYYSITPSGAPLETDKDLYSHAFVIFACAAYLSRFDNTTVRDTLERTTEIVVSRFSSDLPRELPQSCLSVDFASTRIGPRQNPLMHLTEAFLMALQVSEDAIYTSFLDQLLHGITHHFVDEGSGCITELQKECPENWIEPGHQFEWFYLCEQSKHSGFDESGLRDLLRHAFIFAREHGVDTLTSGVAATLSLQGTIIDGTQRIWAQSEYIRALAYHPDPSEQARLPEVIRLFQSRFLHLNGWNECLSPSGEVVRDDMPSTTPYHLIGAYEALAASPRLI